MEEKITNINDLVLFLAVMATKPLLNDGVWQCYGYKKSPQHGAIWNKIFPNKAGKGVRACLLTFDGGQGGQSLSFDI